MSEVGGRESLSRRAYFSAVLIPSFLIVLSFFISSTKAQQSSVDSEFARALWVAVDGGLEKILASDGSSILKVAGIGKARAVAVDGRRGRVWVYAGSSLLSYDFNGVLIASVPVVVNDDDNDDDDTDDDDEDGPEHVALGVNYVTGSVWLGVNKVVLRFGADGVLTGQASLADNVKGVSMDESSGRVWVGTKKNVFAYGDDGSSILSLDLGREPKVEGLDFDDLSGALWVGLKKNIRKYDSAGGLLLEVKTKKPRAITGNGAGGAWVGNEDELLRLDAAGAVVLTINPFGHHSKIGALALDEADKSVWASSKKEIAHVGSGGAVLGVIAVDSKVHDLAVYADVDPPDVSITSPAAGSYVNTGKPDIEISYSDAGSGADPETLVIKLNGSELDAVCDKRADGATCSPSSDIADGEVTITATVSDRAGNVSEPAGTTFTIDTVPPVITLSSPPGGVITNQPPLSFAGMLSEHASLLMTVISTVGGTTVIDSFPVTVNPDFSFARGVTLNEGVNSFTLEGVDLAGNRGEISITVTLDTAAPDPVDTSGVTISPPENGQVTVTGGPGSAEGNSSVVVTNTRTGASVTVQAGDDGGFTAVIAAEGGDALSIVLNDAAGNTSAPAEVEVAVVGGLSPSAIDKTVATTMFDAASFLFSGSSATQTGVAEGTIEPKRIAILRGQVKTRDGQPLPGVTISILNHPEFGMTATRADGMFDMAANGGGWLTVRYAKDGFIPVQRKVDAPWRDWAWADDVVMIPYDDKVTAVDLSAPGMKVARGSVVTDDDGTRQATVFFPEGTTATMTLPDGTIQQLTTLSFRATEFTVGPNGPAAMPAELPPASEYTYAVELSVDEVVQNGVKIHGKDLVFNQPVYLYVDNFLNFPAGIVVPYGYYDNDDGAWVPSDNGRVIKILSVTGGLADLDVDGSGLPADAVALAGLGITDMERQKLASIYSPGHSVWRVALGHFSTGDANWPKNCVCELPDIGDPGENDGPPADCREKNSIIGCQSQTLGESVSVIGASSNVSYMSDRAPGSLADYSLDIELSGATIPSTAKGINLEVIVAGQRFSKSFPAAPNQRYTYTWDGKDAYGRTLRGKQGAKVRVGYTYDAAYGEGSVNALRSFGTTSGVSIIGSKTRKEVYIRREFDELVGGWDGRGYGLGGWTPDVLHFYDPAAKILYRGDGTRREVTNVNTVISTVAGIGQPGLTGGSYPGDGFPADETPLPDPRDVEFAPDGSIYVTSYGGNRVFRITPEGILVTAAGTGAQGFSGDNGPATAARLYHPKGAGVGPDGSLYIADTDNHRIRKVTPSGIITTIAGTGVAGNSGNNGPATSATLRYPEDVAVGPDGAIYIADRDNNRIRRVSPDGIITIFAGNGGGYWSSGTFCDGPAMQTKVVWPSSITFGPDGSVYMTSLHAVCKMDTNGNITKVAGSTGLGYSGDGGPAIDARINSPLGMAFGKDGSLYITDHANHAIRRIGTDGIIHTVAGGNGSGLSGEGGPAKLAKLYGPNGIAKDPDGNLYFADQNNSRIRKLGSYMPRFTVEDIALPSEDGSRLYIFNYGGKHLKTLNALTGAIVYDFAYDADGYLASITDGDGNVTTIERDGAGKPKAVVSPYGQRTTLTLDANGYLASVTDPAGNAHSMTYHDGGLLATFTDPNGHASAFTYDAMGRLIKDENAAGGFIALARSGEFGSYSVTTTTAEGRTKTYGVADESSGGVGQTNTDSSGLTTSMSFGPDGSRTTTSPDGTQTTSQQGPDPRFGMQTPVTTSTTVTTPGGVTSVTTASRSVTLTDASDPLSIATKTDTFTINGRSFTTLFDKTAMTVTDTTPSGRTSSSAIDTRGRVTQSNLPGVLPVDYGYDPRGRMTTISQGSRTSIYTYDAQGYLKTVTDPLGRQVSFTYDAAGRVLSQTLPDGRVVYYTYDAKGNVTSITPPSRPPHGFAYTPVDLESEYDPPDVGLPVDVTRYVYNLDKEVTRIIRPDGKTIDYAYDAGGRLSLITLPGAGINYTYGASGCSSCGGGQMPQSVTRTQTGGDVERIDYTYDGSLLMTTSWSGVVNGSVERVYDADYRIVSRSVNGAHTVNFAYDADGLLTQAGDLTLTRDPSNGFLTASTLGLAADNFNYNQYGEVTSYQASYSGSSIFDVQNTRDNLGRITHKVETVEGVVNSYEYSYDQAGRLITVRKNGAVVSEYVYDANGNRITATVNGVTSQGFYDLQDRMTSYAGATYTYTPNGELMAKTDSSGVTSYEYDEFGNLIKATLPDGAVVEYAIDGNNRRVGKKVNGVLAQGFLYKDQLNPIAELDGSGNVATRFIYGEKFNVPDYMVKGGVTYRIISDHLGSPRLVINTTNGAVAQQINYDEFGNIITNTNPGFQPFGFAGGIYDQHTKLTSFGARDYDAQAGRWTSKDLLGFDGDGLNLYEYVITDPINWVDPFGLMRLPSDPSGLGSEWSKDPKHHNPNDPRQERFRDPSGRPLDWHPGRDGERGWRGEDHWHDPLNRGKEHLPPGTEVPDPAPAPKPPKPTFPRVPPFKSWPGPFLLIPCDPCKLNPSLPWCDQGA